MYTQLVKSILVPLGLTTAVSATEAAIKKKKKKKWIRYDFINNFNRGS